MKINESKLLLMVTGIFTGILITSFIVKTTPQQTKFLTYRGYQELKHDNFIMSREISSLSKSLIELSEKYNKYTNTSKQNKVVLDELEKEYKYVKLMYGMDEVEGQGIIIKLDDRRKGSYTNSFELWNSIVHDFDLREIIVDLKNADAEAIEINGYRIVANTAITCEGPIIMINGRYITPPFIVKAIGDKDALYYAMYNPDSWYKTMELRGLNLSLSKSDKIKVNGLFDDFEPKHITPKK